jgi:hypothetical protein
MVAAVRKHFTSNSHKRAAFAVNAVRTIPAHKDALNQDAFAVVVKRMRTMYLLAKEKNCA